MTDRNSTVKPKATLISATPFPHVVAYLAWMTSRGNIQIQPASHYAMQSHSDPKLAQDIQQSYDQVMDMELPITEMLSATFVIENCPIALREQIVRYQIGHTFWVQSSRIQDFSEGSHYVPASIESNPTVQDYYRRAIDDVNYHYGKLLAMGVPPEDARMVMPVGSNHRLVWHASLPGWFNAIKKRSCWLSQITLWQDVLGDIVSGLVGHFGDAVRRVAVKPPCMDKSGSYTACPFGKETLDTITGAYPQPPCPLFLNNETKGGSAVPLTINGKPVKWRARKDKNGLHWEANDDYYSSESKANTSAADNGRYREHVALRERLWGRSATTFSSLTKATVEPPHEGSGS